MSKRPTTTVSNLDRDAVCSYESRTVYNGFFSVKEHDLSFSKFDGSKSEVVTRSTLVSSDAVIILPYDPEHDRVLLVEQFRAGPYVRGDTAPWCRSGSGLRRRRESRAEGPTCIIGSCLHTPPLCPRPSGGALGTLRCRTWWLRRPESSGTLRAWSLPRA